MQKKLMVAAVAGALAAPAAFAQSSVVIYGTFFPSVESASASGGDANSLAASQAAGLNSSARGAPGAGGINNNGAAAGGGFASAAGTFSATPANLGPRTRTQSAGTNLGFRAREDLGGGMYANVQVELSISPGGIAAPSAGSLSYVPQYRETAVGLGSSSWGEVKIGNWTTPWAINQSLPAAHAGYSNPSANMIGQLLGGLSIFGPAAVSSQEISNFCNAGGASLSGYVNANGTIPANIASTFTSTATGCMAAGTVFTRRMPNSLQWWSPSWNGFDLKLMYATETLRQTTLTATTGPSSLDPYLWSGTLNYSGGALNAGLGYQRHHDFTAFAARSFIGSSTATGLPAGTGAILLGGGVVSGVNSIAMINAGVAAGNGAITGSVDDAWNIRASYTWGGFTLGAYWEQLRYNMSYDAVAPGNVVSLKRSAYRFDGAYVTGPHTFAAQYARTNDIAGSLAGGSTWNGANTNANGWVFGYAYALSKRSGVFAYHTRINNDTNSRYGGIVFGALAPANGGDPRYTGVGIRHTF